MSISILASLFNSREEAIEQIQFQGLPLEFVTLLDEHSEVCFGTDHLRRMKSNFFLNRLDYDSAGNLEYVTLGGVVLLPVSSDGEWVEENPFEETEDGSKVYDGGLVELPISLKMAAADFSEVEQKAFILAEEYNSDLPQGGKRARWYWKKESVTEDSCLSVAFGIRSHRYKDTEGRQPAISIVGALMEGIPLSGNFVGALVEEVAKTSNIKATSKLGI